MEARKKVLNLYAGLGGNRRLWEGCDVIAVENDPKIANVYRRLYPDDDLIEGDAHDFLQKNYDRFDFVWSSPPCPSHSRMMKATRHKVAKFPDFRLYEEVVFLDNFFKGKWVVENVVPYYEPLIAPTVRAGRHLFWSNFDFPPMSVDPPKGFIQHSNLEGKKAMMDWLGIWYEESIYYGKNHCPVQILRNCVHPLVGKHIYDHAFTIPW